MDVKTRLKIIEAHLQELRVALEAQPAATAFDKLVFHATHYGGTVDTVLKARNTQKTARRKPVAEGDDDVLGRRIFARPTDPGLQNLPKEQPKGHSAQHPGLQKHSVGDFYPWAIVGIGNGAVTHYELHNLVTDERVCRKFNDGNVVQQFHGTHGYANARSCLEEVVGHGYAPDWFAYIAKPTPKGAIQR